MNVTFAPREILQIDDARIIYRNFAGVQSKFNVSGKRNFSVVIPDRGLTSVEIASLLETYKGFDWIEEEDCILAPDGQKLSTISEVLTCLGWNVKIRPPRDEDESPFMHLPVQLKFTDRGGPAAYLVTGNRTNELDGESIDILDSVDILSVDLDLRPYDWEMPNGNNGRTAYLKRIRVVQEVDRFAAEFE